MKFYDSKDIKLSEVAHIAIDEVVVPRIFHVFSIRRPRFSRDLVEDVKQV